MQLSIIIPAFNEAAKIEKDILEADSFFQKNSINGEIIVIDDGSTDNTASIAKNQIERISVALQVIKLINNTGKGAAVREGINASKGDIVMYADSGATVPMDNALTGMALITEGKCQFAFGSRKLSESSIVRGQDIDRKIISKLFKWFTKIALQIPKEISDTQCGFKVYSGDAARKLFNKIRINGFLFEIEFIRLALQEGYIIKEFPVTWQCDRDSRLSVRRSAIKIISEILSLWFGRKKL